MYTIAYFVHSSVTRMFDKKLKHFTTDCWLQLEQILVKTSECSWEFEHFMISCFFEHNTTKVNYVQHVVFTIKSAFVAFKNVPPGNICFLMDNYRRLSNEFIQTFVGRVTSFLLNQHRDQFRIHTLFSLALLSTVSLMVYIYFYILKTMLMK